MEKRGGALSRLRRKTPADRNEEVPVGVPSTDIPAPTACREQAETPVEEPSPKPAAGQRVQRHAPEQPSELQIPAEPQETHTPLVASVRPVVQEAHERAGWISPNYSLSRSVALNPRTLEGNRCIAFHSDAPEVEQYRVLRTRIQQHVGNQQGATIMVTSALPGEGKTLTAINLALTFAREFKQTALLVDCDLRQQSIHQLLGYPGHKGLVDYLLHATPVEELFVWPGVEKLTVISGGRLLKDGSELLGSPGMRNLVHDMKHRYPDRTVIFDMPPVLVGADALTFAPLVDYILVAVKAEETQSADVQKALKLLPREKVIGLVLNRHKGKQKAANEN